MPADKQTASPYTPGIQIPPELDIEQQALLSIGYLVGEWANCESLLYGLFRCTVEHAEWDVAPIIWLSFNSTRSRCDLLKRTFTNTPLPKKYHDELARIFVVFLSVTKTRNFYCHSRYAVDEKTGNLAFIENANFTQDERIIKETKRNVSKGMVNELKNAIERCQSLNRSIWPFLLHVKHRLKAQHVELPSLPDGYAHNPRFPLPYKDP